VEGVEEMMDAIVVVNKMSGQIASSVFVKKMKSEIQNV
jgi:hypothetical protein